MATMRTRKLVGTIALLMLVILWTLAAMAAAPSARETSRVVQALYYVGSSGNRVGDTRPS